MPNYDINPNLAGKLPAEGIAHLKQLLSLDQVTNTTAAAVNAATQTALNLKANLASPNFSGVPTLAGAPLATQAWVGTQVSGVITRTAADGLPGSNDLIITGITNPDVGDSLVIPLDGVDTVLGKPRWMSNNGCIVVSIELVDAEINNDYLWTVSIGGEYLAVSTTVNDPSPIGLTYLLSTGEGLPVVASVGVVPAAIGQRCIVGDEGAGDDLGNGNYLEFTSYDGETWELSGPSGVVEDEEAPGTYKKLEFTNGQPVYAPYSILA